MSNLLSTLDAEALLGTLNARYATKLFDSSRTIDDATWSTLEQALVLAPSSFGLQPWKFVVVTDAHMKEQLLPHAWNQPSVTSCSHLVVFYAKNTVSQADIERLMAATVATRHSERASLDGYAGMIGGAIAQMSPDEMLNWNKRQVYLALGQFLVAAALLGVDACPMEGFVPAKFDELLPVEGYSATVYAPAGYRSPDDKYAHLPKVRFPQNEVVEHR